MEIIGKYKDLFFCSLVFLALAFAFIGDKYFDPVDAKFSELATDAIHGAASTFFSPFEKSLDENGTSTTYQSPYKTGQNFWLPAFMYIISTLLCILAIFIYTKMNDWTNFTKLEKGIRLALLIVPCFMGFIFAIGGLKYLSFALFHSLIFLLMIVLLPILLLTFIKGAFTKQS